MSATPASSRQPAIPILPGATMTSMHIPHLPNEVMCIIGSHVDVADLPNLRLSAEVFREGTAARFARIYFQDRVYKLSPVGLQALVKITEHAFFAHRIKSVVLGYGDRIRGNAKYYSLLDQAFSNLAANGNIVSVGLRSLHATTISRHASGVALSKMWQFFDGKMLAAANKAQLRIDQIIIDEGIAPSSLNLPPHITWQDYFVNRARSEKDRIRFSGFRIRTPSTDPRTQLVGEVSIPTCDHGGLEATRARLLNSLSFNRMQYPSLTKVYLHGCEMQYIWLWRLLRHNTASLEHITLYDIKLIPRTSTRSWRMTFALIVEAWAPRLKSCEIGKLWDENGNIWLEGGNKTIKASTAAQVETVISKLTAGIRVFTLEE
ncbi:hypothetical protein E4T39_01845 [Aureobasidium subglaciale]|nr:hypothetical protein E4T39_01845 [Aureobasidium subglaciale]